MGNFFVAHGVSESPLRGQPQVVVIGNFDGVHLGHQALLKIAKEEGLRRGAPTVVLTFDPHPMAILKPPHLRLFDLEDQQAQFRAAGLDGVTYLAFSRDFSELPAEAFMDQILAQEFRPVAVVVGFNFRFGAGRTGDTNSLKQWGARHGIEVLVVDAIESELGPISTSVVRKALRNGDVRKAAIYLGRSFFLSGIVVHGDARGRGIGFPTANLHLEKVETPQNGVYATRTFVGPLPSPSVTHLGPLPTFGDTVVRLETHLLDFEGDLYGKTVRVEFVEKVRDVQKFASIQELRSQIAADVRKAREILGAGAGR